MKTLSQLSGMPQMSAAFAGWMKKITLVKILQITDDDGYVEDKEQKITFNGTIQPLDPEAIMLKPEGQRSFEWLQVHCFATALNLLTNDRILFNSKKYKVMNIYDYSLNNYIEYHLIRDYENISNTEQC